MAIGFAVTGFFFMASHRRTLARLTEFVNNFGDFTPAPETDERLWLLLGFAYMVVITALACRIAWDPIRSATVRCCWRLRRARRPPRWRLMISFIEDDVFVYLLDTGSSTAPWSAPRCSSTPSPAGSGLRRGAPG